MRGEQAAGRDAIWAREVTFLPIKSLQLRIAASATARSPWTFPGRPPVLTLAAFLPVIRPLGNGTGGARREEGALKVLFPGLPPLALASDDASARRVHKGSSLQPPSPSAPSTTPTPSSNTWLRHDSPDPVVLSICYFSLIPWPPRHWHPITLPPPSTYQPTHHRRISPGASRRLPPWPARRGFASWRLPWSSTLCTYFPSSTYTSSVPLSRACACSK